MNPIPYGKQKIEDEDIEAVVRTLKSDFLTQGPAVEEFEKSVTSYLKKLVNDPTEIHALAVNNGTTALHLACLALGVKKGDKVLVTGLSFAASANCVLYCDGDVEFVDISLKDDCLDLDSLERTLSSHPRGTYKGVVMVDFAGFLPDLKRLRKIADQYGLFILEDACHAIGATRADGNQRYAAGACKYSDAAIYSFHPVKHIATGEGGMILTRNGATYERLKMLRTHGITKDPAKMTRNDGGWYHEMQMLGHNGRISDILCALGTSQMKRMDSNLARRREIARKYDQELKNLPVILAPKDENVEHAYHLYVIRAEKRKALYDHLISKKIFVQVHYLPIYQHPYYIERYGKQSLNHCEEYYSGCLSIPMYHSLTDEDQNRVITEIRNFYQNQ